MAHTPENPDLVSAQSSVTTCEQHNRVVDQYCTDCKLFICLVCARLSHVTHNWNSVRQLASHKKKNFKATLEDIRQNIIPLLKKKTETIDRMKVENKTKCKQQAKLLNERQDQIIRKLKEINEQRVRKMSQNVSSKNATLDSMKSEVEEKIKGLISTCTSMEKSKMTDRVFIKSCSSLEDFLKNLSKHTTNISTGSFSLHFHLQNLDLRVLESLAGTVLDTDDITLSEISSFVFGADGINSLMTSSEVTSWLYEQNGTQLVQVGLQGEVLNTVDLKSECDAFAIGPNNEIIATHLEAQTISIIASSGTFKRKLSTTPLEPEGVSLANNDNIFVTLVDSSLEFSLNEKSRRLVRLMSISGDVLRDYEFREDGKSRMFTLPRRVIQRKNSDICVLDFINERQGILQVLTMEGEKLSVYTGRELDQDFMPTDVISDSQDNIILTDPANNVLHLLDSEGQFLKLLTPQQDKFSIPISLSLHNETLWVGNYNGRVNVYRYKNDVSWTCSDS